MLEKPLTMQGEDIQSVCGSQGILLTLTQKEIKKKNKFILNEHKISAQFTLKEDSLGIDREFAGKVNSLKFT